MDVAFLTGMGAFVSAILIFCGSAFLLMMLVMGARLAYLVTASITLAFVLILGVVWSVNPLGPLGQAPAWNPVGIGTDPSQVEFGQASAYPNEPWQQPDTEDETEAAQVADLQSDAQDYVEEAAQNNEVQGLPDIISSANPVGDDTTVLLEQDGDQYGATTLEIQGPDSSETFEVLVVMEYDPGDPLGEARMISLGTFILLVLHLVALSFSEKRARQREPVPA